MLLGLKIAMLAALAFPPLAEWGLRAGLRLFYLHVAFAGFVTLGLVVMAYEEWGSRAVGSRIEWLIAVVVLLMTIVPLTGLWPRELSGLWTLRLAFAGSILATTTVTIACVMAIISNRSFDEDHRRI